MLENIQKYIKECLDSTKSFSERYIEYIMSIQNQNISYEFEYIMKHNNLDIMKLDTLISSSFEEAINCDNF